MKRAVFALFASSALAAGAAQAQAPQPCCVAPPPAYQPQYAQPQYAPPQYAPPPQYQPQYAPPPQYGPPPRSGGLRGYAEPQYPDRPRGSTLRGYVGVEYGKSRLNPGTPSPRVETWTGEAAVAGQTRGFGVQGDIKVANYDTGGNDTTGVSPTLHVYKRNPYGLIGGWAGWSHSGGSDVLGVGAEGQAYLSGATLYGTVGYGHNDNDVADQNLWAARVDGRYFVTENFSIGAQVGLMRASTDTGGVTSRSTLRTVGVGFEYQPGQVPFSIQGSYTHGDWSKSSDESDTLRVGLRWNFDGGTLMERDRTGATLNNMTSLFQTN